MLCFEDRGSDGIQTISRHSLDILVDLVTRLRAKWFKENCNGFLQYKRGKVNFKKVINNKVQALISLIYVQERLEALHLEITKRSQQNQIKYACFDLSLFFLS